MNHHRQIIETERSDQSKRASIVYFSLSFPELSQTFVFNEMRSVAELGADVSVLACRQPTGAHSDLPGKYGFGDKVDTIVDSSLRSSRLRRSSQALKVASRLLLNDITLFPKVLSAANGNDTSVPVSLKLAIAAKLQREPYASSVIHCHFGPAGRVIANLKKRGLIKSPLTTVFHGYDITQYIAEKQENPYSTLFEQADLLIAISDYWHRRLLDLGAPPKKVTTIRLGVDCDAFEYKPRTADPVEPVRFVTVGRMTEKKGHYFTIQAFKALVERRPDLNVSLDIIGDGPELPAIHSLSTAPSLDGKVVMHGALPHHEVRALLDRSHIFVLPSVVAGNGDMEGIPVSIMEAMAMGLPVISTWHSGIPELVKDELSGILVGERDVDALSAAMERLGGQPERLIEMGRMGRLIVEQEYNEKTQARLLMDTLLILASKAGVE
ncbi:glycosyltransferase [Rhizobium sp. WYJ-E13]|uniref:glycosyltransferase n=1 Tax=Rhizobium sp. WYJ-E13 TaxID=2849093 RepID=UPI001C1ECDB3|nr:glycosyltransferase [Rhizobium sp. WYJ-E13]QWW71898.1 glycosyltransferase [Rhizobium sp. WYJ-E13]